jgi:DNA-binding transcriptional MerR regulator
VLTRRTRKPPVLLIVHEAADVLGVSARTLCRALGKFNARRHPINGYRLYREDEVHRLRERIERGEAA